MMLIKTSDPGRQIEKMLEKRERRRRLARRHERDPDEPQSGAVISPAAHALPGMTASSRARHHAKPQAAVIPQSGPNVTPGRSLQDVQNEARKNIFPL